MTRAGIQNIYSDQWGHPLAPPCQQAERKQIASATKNKIFPIERTSIYYPQTVFLLVVLDKNTRNTHPSGSRF